MKNVLNNGGIVQPPLRPAVEGIQGVLLHRNQSEKKTENLYPFHDSSFRKDSIQAQGREIAAEGYVRIVLRLLAERGS